MRGTISGLTTNFSLLVDTFDAKLDLALLFLQSLNFTYLLCYWSLCCNNCTKITFHSYEFVWWAFADYYYSNFGHFITSRFTMDSLMNCFSKCKVCITNIAFVRLNSMNHKNLRFQGFLPLLYLIHSPVLIKEISILLFIVIPSSISNSFSKSSNDRKGLRWASNFFFTFYQFLLTYF